ncbi:MarR family winged helix-turn-helix transcriptional regulator [Actinomadura sp. SCN-SB]|uniref:MarR family winged helix-turn-helix transcriptional regulator n=1 Tax=Actinomadura sp. SCN-SB TaxID=3373092 RepID=UPI003752310A
MDSEPPPGELELAAGLARVSTLMRTLSIPRERSMTSMSTLANLERSGPRRITVLAAEEGVTQPAMTQLVSRLEKDGLAERIAEPGDRRVVAVRVTEAGRAELARLKRIRAARLAALLAELPAADRAAIAAALPALNRLTELACGPAPAGGDHTHRSDT